VAVVPHWADAVEKVEKSSKQKIQPNEALNDIRNSIAPQFNFNNRWWVYSVFGWGPSGV